MTTAPEREGLDDLHGPWPSLADELMGLYGDEWNIYREHEGGTHGDWVAKRHLPLDLTPEGRRAGLTNEIREADSPALRKALAFQHVAHRAVAAHPNPQ